jgi:formylglycine-generating enzyme required for sulfatase activity
MIEKFITFLHKLELEPTPEEVADILWYAAQKLPIASAAANLARKPAPSSLESPTDHSGESTKKSETQSPTEKPEKLPIASAANLVRKREFSTSSSESPTVAPSESIKKPPVQQSIEGQRRAKKELKLYPAAKDNQGIPFRSPSGSALPGALKLVRALRPLMRRVASLHQVRLDEAATAHQIAQTDIWVPVLQPVSIPWLEVAVVVEDSPSMCLWQQTVQELCRLLERQGAFRDVRLWHLDTVDEMVLTTGTSSVKHSYRELINPAASSRVILVVTDCISSVWHNGKMNHWLTVWGHKHAVALVQMLPQQLWFQTQVRAAHLLHVTAPYSGAANKRLNEVRSPWSRNKIPSGGMATPILTLEPDFMAVWVQFIASPTANKKMPALVFKESVTKTGASKAKLSAKQRFIAFKANASPTALQLACLLAATPLTLPIMRLVQKTMLPESQQIHLAEFFLSGLLRRVDTDFSASDAITYDFLVDGFDIRGKLLDMGLVPDAIRVQQIVSEYVAIHYGQPNDFQAKLENPELLAAGGSENEFFAKVSVEVLRRLGGRYARAADSLTSLDSTLAQEDETVSLQTFAFEVVTVDEYGKETKRVAGQANYYSEDLGNNVTLDMVYIPSGEFMMGSPKSERQRYEYEGPQHKVTIKQPFYMGKYSVTQAQWQAIMGDNPSKFQGENRPVEQVSWNEAVEFCKRLSEKSGKEYQLPSEAEWEYACRAGTTTPFHFGETITTDLANYNGNYIYAKEPKGVARKETTEVGSFPPNAFGLYDMHGNVYDWVADSSWHKDYTNAPSDGKIQKGGADKKNRVLRGGSWSGSPGLTRAADRYGGNPDNRYFYLGFRVVCRVVART